MKIYNPAVPAAGSLVWNVTGAVACSVAAMAGCGSGPTAARVPATRANGATGASNVARADYAGSKVCADCHADVAAKWERSPMHRMTRDARGAEVHGPFDGTRWRFHEDAVVLETRAADRFVRIEPAGGAAKEYRVTRVIGGRTREDYAGVDVASGGEEVVLPVSFVYATGALRYKGYSVMVHERATLRAGPVWSQTCIFCHNTVPEMDRLLASIAGAGAPHYQGEEVDALLPLERRARVRVTDEPAFAAATRVEIARLGGVAAPGRETARAVARRTIDVVRDGFDARSLVEVGIGCEACHGGARAHAERPESVRPSLDPTAPWLAVDLPKPSHAASVNRVCARCHQVLFSRYPYTWEGGKRGDATAGGSHINSGEARDFLLGGCADAMACTACHDPHGADTRSSGVAGSPPDRFARLATPAGNATCTGCHRALANGDALRSHAHHDPTGAGGSCVACHMPRKNMGLDGRLTRYHRIGSPTDPARVLGDRPLECALCHADASVATLVDAMEKWWPVRYPRQRLEELYGSLGANVVRATLERGRPHEKAVAIGVLAEAGAKDAAPLVARELQDDYPLVREWAKRALEKLGASAGLQAPASGPREDSNEEPED